MRWRTRRGCRGSGGRRLLWRRIGGGLGLLTPKCEQSNVKTMRNREGKAVNGGRGGRVHLLDRLLGRRLCRRRCLLALSQ